MKIQIDVCAGEAIKRGYEPGRHVISVCVKNLSQEERDLLSGHVRRRLDDDVYELYSSLGVDVPDEPTWAGVFAVLKKAQEREQARMAKLKEETEAAKQEAARLLAQGQFDLHYSEFSRAGSRWSIKYPNGNVQRALDAEPGAYERLSQAACAEVKTKNDREHDEYEAETEKIAKADADKKAEYVKAKIAWLRSHDQVMLADKVEAGFPCETLCYSAVAEYYRKRLQALYPAAAFIVDTDMDPGQFLTLTSTFPTDASFLLYKALKDDVNFVQRVRLRLFEAEGDDDQVDCVQLEFACPWNTAATDYLLIYAFPESNADEL